MTLKDIQPGQWARIKAVGASGTLREHLLDMGIIPGLDVQVRKFAPMGDPVEIFIRGYVLTLRLSEAGTIEAEPVESPADESCTREHIDFGYNLSLHEHNAHPGYGEAGKYHSRDHENALPKGTVLRFAIVGQHNCGKTALFNVLTGSNQHVGNFPGNTLESKEAAIMGVSDAVVTDLPGLYSLTTTSSEEIVTREYILNNPIHCIINVVDANNLERNLYLTLQLMEMGIPIVLAVNMMDELTGNGGSIRINEMERQLGIPVVPVSADRNEGIGELLEHAVHVATYQEVPEYRDFCSKEDFSGAVHRCIHGIIHLVESKAKAAGLTPRFAASRIIVGDSHVIEKLGLTPKEQGALEAVISQMEEERGLDRLASMADMRYAFISKLCRSTLVKPGISKEYRRSVAMDRILTGKWTALPILVAVMFSVIWLSIDIIGSPLQDLISEGIATLSSAASKTMMEMSVAPAVQSLVTNALFGGVGTVVSFVPIIIVLFFFLSLLEDSGYMARVAFVTDKILRRIGLTGRSIVPLLVGFGCSVPAVMATRTLPSALDRKKTILLTPFMSCSAKIPVYAFLTTAFFPGHGGLALICLYLLALTVGVLTARVTKNIGDSSEAAPFVMELPNYRLPRLGNLLHLLWDKCKDFLQQAFSVILIASIVIWFLQTFDSHLNIVENGEGSMLAVLSGFVAPIFSPMGLGDWRIVTSLISGFLAKETIVSTMQLLGVTASLTVLTAIPLLVFCLLYTPCVAAIAAVRRELGSKWAIFIVAFQCSIAWFCALLAYFIASWII